MIDPAKLRELASGRDKWFAMGREEKSYFIDFDSESEACRWMDDQRKRMKEWVDREGIHIVKQRVLSEADEMMNAAADQIESLTTELAGARTAIDVYHARIVEMGLEKTASPKHWSPTYNTDPVQRACNELPEDFQIEIFLELGSGWVELRGPDAEKIEFDDEADQFDWKIHAAIDAALSATKEQDK